MAELAQPQSGGRFWVGEAREVLTVVGLCDFNEYGQDDLHLSPGDVVVDIGAHVGAFSITIARRWPDVRVIAYEPNPRNFEFLQQNIAENDVVVEAHQVAVWEHDRGVGIVATGADTGTVSEDAIPQWGDAVWQQVPSVTLEAALQGLPEVALMKLDCEGAEVPLILATPLPVLRKVRHIVGEFHAALEDTVQAPWFKYLAQAFPNLAAVRLPNPIFTGTR